MSRATAGSSKSIGSSFGCAVKASAKATTGDSWSKGSIGKKSASPSFRSTGNTVSAH